jgi:hypothetical protein
LEESVAAVEKQYKVEREKTKLLEGRLAEAEKQLDATRTPLADAETENLRSQLLIVTQNGISISRCERGKARILG